MVSSYIIYIIYHILSSYIIYIISYRIYISYHIYHIVSSYIISYISYIISYHHISYHNRLHGARQHTAHSRAQHLLIQGPVKLRDSFLCFPRITHSCTLEGSTAVRGTMQHPQAHSPALK